jgi:A-factor biosynthesis hotdog protein
MAPSAYVEQLRSWEGSSEARPGERIDKTVVHKLDVRNVFVSRVAQVSPESPDEHVAQLSIDVQHPYHFEHAQDHVPGMMLVEAGRQLAMAIAHIYYRVSLDAVFVLNEVSIAFNHFAELGAPVFVHSRVRDKVFRRDQLVAMSMGGDFIQNGEVLGSMSGRWTMFERALIERLRRRGRGEKTAAVVAPPLPGELPGALPTSRTG